MRPALLDMRLAGGPVGADGRVDPDDRADPVHQGKQLVELLGCDLLVLGAGVAHHLVLIHLLVACQHVRGPVSAPSQDAGQSGEVEQLAGCGMLLRPGVLDHARLMEMAQIDLVGGIETPPVPVLIGAGEDVAVLVAEAGLEEGLPDIAVVRLELVARELHHDRLQAPLAHDRPEPVVAGDAGRGAHELHRREVPALAHMRLDEVPVLFHGPEGLTVPEGLLDARGGLVGEVHAAGLAAPPALLEGLPGQKLALAGRVHIGRDADLVDSRQLAFQLRDDIGAALQHALLPGELREVPGKAGERPFLHGFRPVGGNLPVGRQQAHDVPPEGAYLVLHAGIRAGISPERLREVTLRARFLREYEDHRGSFLGRRGRYGRFCFSRRNRFPSPSARRGASGPHRIP